MDGNIKKSNLIEYDRAFQRIKVRATDRYIKKKASRAKENELRGA